MYYDRAGHDLKEESGLPQQSTRPQTGDGIAHYRVPSNSTPPQIQDRPHTSLARAAIPVGKSTPSWTTNPLRGTRSQEQLKAGSGGGRSTSRPLRRDSPEPKLETLSEQETPRNDSRVSTTTDLREQMHELKHRISSLKERAREDSLRRRSVQTLRQPCPLIHSHSDPPETRHSRSREFGSGSIGRVPALLPDTPSPPPSDSGDIVFDPRLGYAAVSPHRSSHNTSQERATSSGHKTDFFSCVDDKGTATSLTESYRSSDPLSEATSKTIESSETESIYEDAADEPVPFQRHEDREDAFDYGHFFLHSSMGTFSKVRRSSMSSTDSEVTTKGPSMFQQVPPTPETPENLRNIERGIHARAISKDSIETTASFATAREAIRSGRQTPVAIAEWLLPKSRDGRTNARGDDRADSGVGVAEQTSGKHAGVSRVDSRSRSRSSTHASYKSHRSNPSSNLSSASVAVSAITDAKAQKLGFQDKTLVLAVVENLRQICEKLQAGDESEFSGSLLRKRLDSARKMLDGSLPVV